MCVHMKTCKGPICIPWVPGPTWSTWQFSGGTFGHKWSKIKSSDMPRRESNCRQRKTSNLDIALAVFPHKLFSSRMYVCMYGLFCFMCISYPQAHRKTCQHLDQIAGSFQLNHRWYDATSIVLAPRLQLLYGTRTSSQYHRDLFYHNTSNHWNHSFFSSQVSSRSIYYWFNTIFERLF